MMKLPAPFQAGAGKNQPRVPGFQSAPALAGLRAARGGPGASWPHRKPPGSAWSFRPRFPSRRFPPGAQHLQALLTLPFHLEARTGWGRDSEDGLFIVGTAPSDFPKKEAAGGDGLNPVLPCRGWPLASFSLAVAELPPGFVATCCRGPGTVSLGSHHP